jgi:hypothetical protein
MPKINREDLLVMKVAGITLREWDRLWEDKPGGFSSIHPELRSKVGLFRAVLHGEIMYIMRATEYLGGGIEKGLTRIRGPQQSGNSGYGAQMVRENMPSIQLQVLSLDATAENADHTKELKKLMIKLHDPVWNLAHTKKMNDMRDSKAATSKKKS